MEGPVSNTAGAGSSASGNTEASERANASSSRSTVANSNPEPRRVEDSFTPSGIEEGERSGILRVPEPKERIAFPRNFFPIFGKCPDDQPLGHELTYGEDDRRIIPPLTLRYRAKVDDACIIQRHDEVTVAIWNHLQKCSPAARPTDDRPAIVFHQGTAIEVTFGRRDIEAFKQARGSLAMIQVEAVARGQSRIIHFELESWSNNLPSDVMPIDILQFPDNQGFTDELVACLDDMVVNIGKVIGAAFVYIGPFPGGPLRLDTNVARLYVKLSRKSMSLEHSQLLELLPTHFRWEGFRCSLQYAGRPRSIERISRDYPLDNKSEDHATGTTSATHLSSASSSNNSSSGASKKRKSGET